MSSSQSSQFPPKSIVKNKSYEGVETLRQIASTSLFLDKEQKSNAISGGGVCQTIPTIKEPTDEGSSNASLINLMPQANDAILEPPIEMMMKMDTLKVDTLNVIDILSLTDSETEREIHQIDINQEVVIPRVEPTSLFSDDDDDKCDVGDLNELIEDESQLDSDGNKKSTAINKLNRQRTSLNQSKVKEADTLLMETSLMIIDPAPLSPPPFSPPPLPISPNIVTTTFNIPSTLSLTLPLTNTTTSTSSAAAISGENSTDDRQHIAASDGGSRRHKHHHHHHHHHHKGSSSQHKHKHSSNIGRSASTDDRGQPIKDSHQFTEAELVLSPSKLGQ